MKKLMSYLAVGTCTALLGVAVTATAGTTTPDMPVLSLTEKLDMGGTILEPGDYRIKVIQVGSDRNLLEVIRDDGMEILATVLSVPHSQEGMEGEQLPANRLAMYPTVGDQTPVLRTWYPPNTPLNGGHDIVYPRLRAVELAARADYPVVSFQDDVKLAEYKTAPLVVVTPKNDSRPYKFSTTQTPRDTRQAQQMQETQTQRDTRQAQQAAADDTRQSREWLPQTASNLPLYAGLGLLSILGALGLGVIAKRIA